MIDAHPKRHIFIGEHITQTTTGVLKKSTPQDLKIEGKEQLFAAYLFGKVSISAGAIAIHHSVFDSIKYSAWSEEVTPPDHGWRKRNHYEARQPAPLGTKSRGAKRRAGNATI